MNSIDLRRVFFALRKYFDTHFWGQYVMPGAVWWVVHVWAESPIQILSPLNVLKTHTTMAVIEHDRLNIST